MAALTANAPEVHSGEIRVTRNVQFSKLTACRCPSTSISRLLGDRFPSSCRFTAAPGKRHAAQPGMVLAILRRTRLPRRSNRLPARTGVDMAGADRGRAHGSLLAVAGGGEVRRRPEPRRAGGPIGGCAACDAPRLPGGPMIHTSGRQLLRARRSRRRLASTAKTHPANARAILEAFIGGTPDQKPEHYRHALPITWVSRRPRRP